MTIYIEGSSLGKKAREGRGRDNYRTIVRNTDP